MVDTVLLGSRIGFDRTEDALYGIRFERISPDSPVFVTACRRLDRFIVLSLLVEMDRLASHICRRMTFVLCPALARFPSMSP